MDLITLTQALRNQIMENYYKYKKEVSNDNDEVEEDLDELDDEEDILDNETDDENIQIDDDELEDDDDECDEELYSIYDEEVILKVIDDIKNSMYKNLIHMIIFSDCLEYIKSRAVRKRFISNDEKYLLILLENFNTKKLLKIIDTDDEFLLDVMTIFLEYNITCTNEEKYENRLILKRQKTRISKQFKLSILDDIQQYYDKNK